MHKDSDFGSGKLLATLRLAYDPQVLNGKKISGASDRSNFP
jgi:hypothetical protein